MQRDQQRIVPLKMLVPENDLEGSTRLWEEHPEAMRDARRATGDVLARP